MTVPDWRQHNATRTLQWLNGLPCPPVLRQHASCDNDSVPNLETMLLPCCHWEPETLLQQHFLQAACPTCHSTNSVKMPKDICSIITLSLVCHNLCYFTTLTTSVWHSFY